MKLCIICITVFLTVKPIDADYNSCNGFCGKEAVGCWCDNFCTKYGDCCPDYLDYCEAPTTKTTTTTTTTTTTDPEPTGNHLGLCPTPKVGYRIVATHHISYIEDIKSYDACSAKCKNVKICVAWTWSNDPTYQTHVCFLFSSSPNRLTVSPSFPLWTSGQKETCPPDIMETDMSYPDEKFCDDDLRSFLTATNNSTLTIKCCNPGAKISTCVGLGCLTMCGRNITCMIPHTNLASFTECTESDLAILVNTNACKGFANHKPNAMCPTRYTDRKCACCKYSLYSPCSFHCRCNGICSYFRSIGFSIAFISWCKGCPNPNPQGLTGLTINPMDTTDLASPSVPYNFPTTSYSYSETSEVNCSMCNITQYAHDNTEACKCNCTCNFITGCTGYEEAEQWSQCWTDYSFCCECSEDGQYYGTPCPGTCKEEGDSNAYDITVKNGITRTRTDCNI